MFKLYPDRTLCPDNALIITVFSGGRAAVHGRHEFPDRIGDVAEAIKLARIRARTRRYDDEVAVILLNGTTMPPELAGLINARPLT